MEQSGVTHKIKECMSNIVNKSQTDMATLHPDKSGKWSVKLQMFYNKYFPTDKVSYVVRVPVVSLVLSLCALQVTLNLQWTDPRESIEYVVWAIILLLLAATYGLYYGLKIGDRKQFTPWIIFKTIEIITMFYCLICFLMGRYWLNGSNLRVIVLGFGVLVGNIFVLFTIYRRKKEDFVADNENIDEFSPVILTT